VKQKHKSTIFFIVAQYLSMFVNKIEDVCVCVFLKEIV